MIWDICDGRIRISSLVSCINFVMSIIMWLAYLLRIKIGI